VTAHADGPLPSARTRMLRTFKVRRGSLFAVILERLQSQPAGAGSTAIPVGPGGADGAAPRPGTVLGSIAGRASRPSSAGSPTHAAPLSLFARLARMCCCRRYDPLAGMCETEASALKLMHEAAMQDASYRQQRQRLIWFSLLLLAAECAVVITLPVLYSRAQVRSSD